MADVDYVIEITHKQIRNAVVWHILREHEWPWYMWPRALWLLARYWWGAL